MAVFLVQLVVQEYVLFHQLHSSLFGFIGVGCMFVLSVV